MSLYPVLLGHRGARATTSVPENSLASFDLALEHGCDGFEFDVRLTADGHGIICHDPRVQGMEIAQATRADLSHLCTLHEVLGRYGDRAFLDIELKTAGLDGVLLTALNVHRPPRFVVSSFLPEVLTSLRVHDASLPLGFICDVQAQLQAWRSLPVEYVIPHFRLTTQKLMEDLRAAGKKTFVWTVNDPSRMSRLMDWGVDGIISDETGTLVKTVRGRG